MDEFDEKVLLTSIKNRMDLQDLLEKILGVTTDERVQFQPAEGTKLKLPNLTYRMTDVDASRADNRVYRSRTAYEVTLKDKNPDSKYLSRLRQIPCARFIRFATGNGFNAWTFRVWTEF